MSSEFKAESPAEAGERESLAAELDRLADCEGWMRGGSERAAETMRQAAKALRAQPQAREEEGGTLDPAFVAWLKERDCLPNDDDGTIEWADIVCALNDWEADLTQAREDGDEAYDLGKRDGYEQAVQDVDLLTGGDGEYVFATDGGGCPDAEAMKARIAERFQAREDAQPWAYGWYDSGGGKRVYPYLPTVSAFPEANAFPLYTHLAPNALRAAVEKLEIAKITDDPAEVFMLAMEALAALQSEQEGGDA